MLASGPLTLASGPLLATFFSLVQTSSWATADIIWKYDLNISQGFFSPLEKLFLTAVKPTLELSTIIGTSPCKYNFLQLFKNLTNR